MLTCWLESNVPRVRERVREVGGVRPSPGGQVGDRALSAPCEWPVPAARSRLGSWISDESSLSRISTQAPRARRLSRPDARRLASFSLSLFPSCLLPCCLPSLSAWLPCSPARRSPAHLPVALDTSNLPPCLLAPAYLCLSIPFLPPHLLLCLRLCPCFCRRRRYLEKEMYAL